eukprot:3791742-Rhodomonas_salina.1
MEGDSGVHVIRVCVAPSYTSTTTVVEYGTCHPPHHRHCPPTFNYRSISPSPPPPVCSCGEHRRRRRRRSILKEIEDKGGKCKRCAGRRGG